MLHTSENRYKTTEAHFQHVEPIPPTLIGGHMIECNFLSMSILTDLIHILRVCSYNLVWYGSRDK